eukprot:CAMPEP_0184688552 /NCGR_PEP_ID=MMETSP0312-20130426/30162_1 /TAXON_ID=31354 /ORGANISM="Compsopogon coeruleus, Strain SAG 36.94" /LENGTH=58 /DNA_ID=CAMNT_0027145803 /DNA_START=57 /DNA_END=233 /DNA_ORIENTATION=-
MGGDVHSPLRHAYIDVEEPLQPLAASLEEMRRDDELRQWYDAQMSVGRKGSEEEGAWR